jgi:hypothetical protein
MTKHRVLARLLIRLVPAAAFLLLGCGRGRGDITGEVSYKGEPISVGRITFLSQVGNQEVKSVHIIRGKYTITGFPVGPAKICVESMEPPDKEILENTKKLNIPAAGGMKEHMKGLPPELVEMAAGPPLKYIPIPLAYANPESSRLTYEVKPGAQTYDIPLKPQ